MFLCFLNVKINSPTARRTVGAEHQMMAVRRSDNGSETVFGSRADISAPHICRWWSGGVVGEAVA